MGLELAIFLAIRDWRGKSLLWGIKFPVIFAGFFAKVAEMQRGGRK